MLTPPYTETRNQVTKSLQPTKSLQLTNNLHRKRDWLTERYAPRVTRQVKAHCSLVLSALLPPHAYSLFLPFSLLLTLSCSDSQTGIRRKLQEKQVSQSSAITAGPSMKFREDMIATNIHGATCSVPSGHVIHYKARKRLDGGGMEVHLTKPVKGCSGKRLFFFSHSHNPTNHGGGTYPEFYDHISVMGHEYGGETMETDQSLSYLSSYQTYFPLYSKPLEDFTIDGREFGAARAHGRKHAANDLVEYPGNPVYAVADGTILDVYEFYYGSLAVVIDHGNFVVRYGEIRQLWEGLKIGDFVRAGQKIARVSFTYMLHFEKYSGHLSGPLTVSSNHPFQRRKDLITPTPFLKALIATSSYPPTW